MAALHASVEGPSHSLPAGTLRQECSAATNNPSHGQTSFSIGSSWTLFEGNADPITGPPVFARLLSKEKKLPVGLLGEFEQFGGFGGIIAYHESVGREF